MGKYAIMALFGAMIALGYIVLSSNTAKLGATENVQTRFERRVLQNVAVGFADEAAGRLMKMKEMAHFQIDSVKVKYNYSLTLNDADLGRITVHVVTVNNHSTGMEDSLRAGEFRITATAQKASGGLIGKSVVYDYKVPLCAYAWFINADMTGYLCKGEDIYGPWFVNGRARVQWDGTSYPILDGPVTTTNHLLKGGTSTILDSSFPGLTHTNNNFTAPAVSMPDLGVSTEQRALSLNLDSIVSGSTDLYMRLDGSTVRVYTDAAMTSQVYSTAVISVANSTIYTANRNLHILGTLTGKLTVSTDKILYVDGDVMYSSATYADGKLSVPQDSEDFLGLIAERKVVISTRQIPYLATGNFYNPDGCKITACVYTRKKTGDASSTGAIEMENFMQVPSKGVYRIYPSSSTSPSTAWKNVKQDRGKFIVYGGRVQDLSLVTWADKSSSVDGTYSWGTQGYSGFKEMLQHDARMIDNAPPAFPNVKSNALAKFRDAL